MTIYDVDDLIEAAQRLPKKWKRSFMNNLEDWKAQFEIWREKPETLSNDESTHAGIKLMSDRLLRKKKETTEQ